MDHKRSDSGYSSIGISEFSEAFKNFNLESLELSKKKKKNKRELMIYSMKFELLAKRSEPEGLKIRQ
jgi:hypothetical protein